jgi:hypothetical protein
MNCVFSHSLLNNFYKFTSLYLILYFVAQAIYIGTENVLLHLLRLCAYPSTSLEMKSYTQDSVPHPPDNAAAFDEWVKWEVEWWDSLAQCLRINRTRLAAEDKKGFIEFWKKNH